MDSYARTDYADSTLMHCATTHATGRRTATADLLADIAEIDARKLYLPAAYPSMAAYCVGDLKLSEQTALKAIRVARLARRFPAIFDLVARGRLNLSDVVLLAPHLTEHTANDLLAAAADKTRVEIERLLAERFPHSDVLSLVTPRPSLPPPAAASASECARGVPGDSSHSG
jgi:hypothetical protein